MTLVTPPCDVLQTTGTRVGRMVLDSNAISHEHVSSPPELRGVPNTPVHQELEPANRLNIVVVAVEGRGFFPGGHTCVGLRCGNE